MLGRPYGKIRKRWCHDSWQSQKKRESKRTGVTQTPWYRSRVNFAPGASHQNVRTSQKCRTLKNKTYLLTFLHLARNLCAKGKKSKFSFIQFILSPTLLPLGLCCPRRKPHPWSHCSLHVKAARYIISLLSMIWRLILKYSVLRQVHRILQSEFPTDCHLLFPLSISITFSFS